MALAQLRGGYRIGQVADFLRRIANMFFVLLILTVIMFAIGTYVSMNKKDFYTVLAFGAGVLFGIVSFRLAAAVLDAVMDRKHEKFTVAQKFLVFGLAMLLLVATALAISRYPLWSQHVTWLMH